MIFVLLVVSVAAGVANAQIESCYVDDGCVVNTPSFWTQLGVITFNFSGLAEGQNDQLADYQWGLGEIPGDTGIIAYQSVESTTSSFKAFNVATLEGQDVVADDQKFTNQTVYALNVTLQSQYLVNGENYSVNVLYNGDGIQRNASSAPVTVVTNPPLPRMVGLAYPDQTCENQDTLEETRDIWVCWDAFTYTVVPVVAYYIQFYEAVYSDTSSIPYGPKFFVNEDVNASALQRPDENRLAIQIFGLHFREGQKYYILITGVNAAGLYGETNSALFLVATDSRLSPAGVALVVAGSIVAGVLALAGIVYWVLKQKSHHRKLLKKLKRDKQKHLKSLMYSLVTKPNADGKLPADFIREAQDVCLVFTDVESSTTHAEKSPEAFTVIQDIHDTIIREGIQKNSGYEVLTEGDSFAVAFEHVHNAVVFAMDIQYRLTDTLWPKAVLKMPSCAPEFDKDGELLRAGPRVRIGIHYAEELSIVRRHHVQTRLRTFSGPGFVLTNEICDTAHGGQVLLTEPAWQQLSKHMAAAQFPTVAQIGLYKFDHWQSHIWIYEITQLLGRRPYSPKKPLRKHNQVESGWGYNIVRPPTPREMKYLTFVYCRLDTKAAGTKAVEVPSIPGAFGGFQSTLRSLKGKFARKKDRPARDVEMRALSFKTTNPQLSPGKQAEEAQRPEIVLPEAVQNLLFDNIVICAMQFCGYVSQIQKSQGNFGVVFENALDALRFAHAAQVRLLYTEWPLGNKELYRLFGPTEQTTDARMLFNGPRLAMAIHETGEFRAERVDLTSLGQRESEMSYSGSGVDLAMDLAYATQGGQVLLSETAWANVQDRLPGSTHSVSLGTAIVKEGSSNAMLLMENMPTLLHLRSFPKPNVYRTIEPGYRDSPDPRLPVAIVFTKVCKPNIVKLAEAGSPTVSEPNIVRVLTQYHIAVMKVSRVIRHVLSDFEGYECKETESGKFTLAFHTLESAIRWACKLSTELMETAWPAVLREWEECQEEFITISDEQQMIWNGPRLHIGMTYGKPQYRKPLNTGRADYYGSVPNLASRICHLAQPGQILIEGSSGFSSQLKWISKGSEREVAILPADDPSALDAEDIELKFLGFYALRGITQPKLVIQALPKSLTHRVYPGLKAPLAADLPRSLRRGPSHSFISLASSQDSMHPSLTSLQILARKGSSLASSLPFDILRRYRGTREDYEQNGSFQENENSIGEEGEEPLQRPEPSQGSNWGGFAETLADRCTTAQTLSRLSTQRLSGSTATSPRRFTPASPGRGESAGVGNDAEEGGHDKFENDLHIVRRVQSAADHSEQASAPSFSSQSADPTSPDSLYSPPRSVSAVQASHVPSKFPRVVSTPASFTYAVAPQEDEYAAKLAHSFARAGAHRLSAGRKSLLRRTSTPPPADLRSVVSLPPQTTSARQKQSAANHLSDECPSTSVAILSSRQLLPEESPSSPRENAPRTVEEMTMPPPEPSPFLMSPHGPDAEAFRPPHFSNGQNGLPRAVSASSHMDMDHSFSSTGDVLHWRRASLDDGGWVDSPRGSSSPTPRSRHSKHTPSRATAIRNALLDVIHRRQAFQQGAADTDRPVLQDPSSIRGEISTVPEEPDGPTETQK